MRMSNPLPGARFSAVILVMCAMACCPSSQMLTVPSSLGSTVARDPRLRRMPTPRDPVHMMS